MGAAQAARRDFTRLTSGRSSRPSPRGLSNGTPPSNESNTAVLLLVIIRPLPHIPLSSFLPLPLSLSLSLPPSTCNANMLAALTFSPSVDVSRARRPHNHLPRLVEAAERRLRWRARHLFSTLSFIQLSTKLKRHHYAFNMQYKSTRLCSNHAIYYFRNFCKAH